MLKTALKRPTFFKKRKFTLGFFDPVNFLSPCSNMSRHFLMGFHFCRILSLLNLNVFIVFRNRSDFTTIFDLLASQMLTSDLLSPMICRFFSHILMRTLLDLNVITTYAAALAYITR